MSLNIHAALMGRLGYLSSFAASFDLAWLDDELIFVCGMISIIESQIHLSLKQSWDGGGGR